MNLDSENAFHRNSCYLIHMLVISPQKLQWLLEKQPHAKLNNKGWGDIYRINLNSSIPAVSRIVTGCTPSFSNCFLRFGAYSRTARCFSQPVHNFAVGQLFDKQPHILRVEACFTVSIFAIQSEYRTNGRSACSIPYRTDGVLRTRP